MSKNNFFVKFAYWYKSNFSLIKENFEIIRDGLNEICVYVFVFIICLISCVLPTLQIYKAIKTRYYTDEELAKLGYTAEAGYYSDKNKRDRQGGVI